MKSLKILAVLILVMFSTQSQANAYYYSTGRSADQEVNQVTDLDGNTISGYQNNYSSNTYNQCYDSYNHTYYNCNSSTSTTNKQCYDSYNHTYYNCNSSTSTTNKQCYDSYNHTYYNCNSSSSSYSSNQCYDSYNHTYYNCNSSSSSYSSNQCYDNYNHTYYNCSSTSSSYSSNQCYDSYNHTYYNCNNNNSTSVMKMVYIQNNAISPSTITIPKGSYVKWVSRDSTTHHIVGDYTSYKIDSGNLYLNYTYSKTFSTVGTFRYHDANNTNIKGTIIVTN